MYPAPQEITTEVFATLPSSLRAQPGRQAVWGGAPRDSFLEGPVFDRKGELHCANVPYGQILRVDRNGRVSVCASYDGEPNGLAVSADGRFFVCDYRHGVMVASDGVVTPLVARFRAERFKGVNDLTFARNGDLYFTDQGETGLHDPAGRIFRLCVDGTLDMVLSGIPSPNGLALTDDDRTLLVAVTRANAIWRVPLLTGGAVGRVGTFIQLSGGIGPDGMAVDSAGRIAVAHLGIGSVWVFQSSGEPIFRVRSVEGRGTTNVAFDPRDERDLYITEADSGSVLRARLPA